MFILKSLQMLQSEVVMFSSRIKAQLKQSQADNAQLLHENAALQARVNELEQQLSAETNARTQLQRERTIHNGVFNSLGTFGSSLNGVKNSFEQLTLTLNEEKNQRYKPLSTQVPTGRHSPRSPPTYNRPLSACVRRQKRSARSIVVPKRLAALCN